MEKEKRKMTVSSGNRSLGDDNILSVSVGSELS
mgnify:FL=1